MPNLGILMGLSDLDVKFWLRIIKDADAVKFYYLKVFPPMKMKLAYIIMHTTGLRVSM